MSDIPLIQFALDYISIPKAPAMALVTDEAATKGVIDSCYDQHSHQVHSDMRKAELDGVPELTVCSEGW